MSIDLGSEFMKIAIVKVNMKLNLKIRMYTIIEG